MRDARYPFFVNKTVQSTMQIRESVSYIRGVARPTTRRKQSPTAYGGGPFTQGGLI